MEDEFGLPSLALSLIAPPAERQAVASAIRTTAERLFAAAVRHIGERDARELWADVYSRKPGPKGNHDSGGDLLLINMFDYVLSLGTVPKPQIPRHLAERFAKPGGRFGISASAIQKRVRRLVNQRDLRQKRQRMSFAGQLLAARAAAGAAASILLEDGQKSGED